MDINGVLLTDAYTNSADNTSIRIKMSRPHTQDDLCGDLDNHSEWQFEPETKIATEGETRAARREYTYTLFKRRRLYHDAPDSDEKSAHVKDKDSNDDDTKTPIVQKLLTVQNTTAVDASEDGSLILQQQQQQHSETKDTNKTRPSRYQRKQDSASCHRCKTRKPFAVMLFCTQLYPYVQTKGEYTCRKKYCFKCLRISPHDFSDEERNKWTCPSCLGICSCPKCGRERRRDMMEASSMVTRSWSCSAPPLSLSTFCDPFSHHEQDKEQEQVPLSPLSPLASSPLSFTGPQNVLPVHRRYEELFLPSLALDSSLMHLDQEPCSIVETISTRSSATISSPQPIGLDLVSGDAISDLTPSTINCLEPSWPPDDNFHDASSSSSITVPTVTMTRVDDDISTLVAIEMEHGQEKTASQMSITLKYKITSACVNCRRVRMRCETTR